ncbi:13591_t:CDS:2, partial [Acaulospora morrowiae]
MEEIQSDSDLTVIAKSVNNDLNQNNANPLAPVDQSNFTPPSGDKDRENPITEPSRTSSTDNLNCSVGVESSNTVNDDPMRVESFDAVKNISEDDKGVSSDIDDPLDLCNEIPSFYRLLDLCKDMGSIGYSVDKIIISQEFLRKLCNDMVPNSFKSISEVNYASLNSRSLGLVGIYGNRETIAEYLLQKNAINKTIHHLLVKSQTNDNESSKSMMPHLRPGVYLLVENKYGLIIHWPEKDCYSIRASDQKKKNLVNLHRYLTKLTNVNFCLMNAQDLMNFDFELNSKYIEEEDDDDQVCGEYKVEERKQEEEDFKFTDGFKINFDNRNSKGESSLPLSFPPAMPIESYNNQSFITCRMTKPEESSKEYTLNGNANQGKFINQLKNYTLRINSSVTMDELINLAEVLSIGSQLVKTYKDKTETARKDHEKEKNNIDDNIKIESNIIFSMLGYELSKTY